MLDVQRLKELHAIAEPPPWRQFQDAVDARDRYVFENGSGNDIALTCEMRNALPELLTHIDSLTARVSALEDALRPLAMGTTNSTVREPDETLVDITVTRGQIRRARAALATTYPANEEGT